MGILDDLKHKAEELGEKAKEGLDVARDKAGDLVGDVRERLGEQCQRMEQHALAAMWFQAARACRKQ